MSQLDSDLLRTFVAIAEAGSVTDGAVEIGRSQSAASLQIKRLESVLGRDVFERHGRGVVLTDAGRHLILVARDVVARLDGALREIASDDLEGKLRLGIPDDHGQAKLSQIVGAFAQAHPLVELEVTCALSAEFPQALSKGRLDLAVYEVEQPDPDEEVLFEDPTCWVASPYRDFSETDPLPVALFDRTCWWRDVALASLEARNRPFRVIYSSQSVGGVMAAVEGGIGVGLLGRSSVGEGLKVLGADHGFGATPVSKLVVRASDGADTELVLAMKAAIRTAFRD